jgi:tRNA (pseudouridine54-N1)-methyltransferase
VTRRFVVIGHDAPTRAGFSLDDLPGAGRLDALCRCVTSALLLSHDIREDVSVHLVLDDEYTISFAGGSLRGLNPDERSTAALIRNALADRTEAVGHVAVETSPGVSIDRRGIAALLADVAREGTVLQLQAEGRPAVEMDPPADPVFVLSDHREFTGAEGEAIAGVADEQISLGPRRLHGNQAITVAHNWLDTDGYGPW